MNETTTTPWNRLQALLDTMFGFTNRIRSTVKVLKQGFDNDTQEHVVWIEYRAQVKPSIAPKATAEPTPVQNRSNAIERPAMASIRELFAHGKQRG
jgi:hypothetical protein